MNSVAIRFMGDFYSTLDDEAVVNDLKTILAKTADYQRNDIILTHSADVKNGSYVLDVYTDDIQDYARTRKALRDAFQYLVDILV